MIIEDLSVVTIVSGRAQHLNNILAGLAKGAEFPAEMVIVSLDEQPPELPNYPFQVRIVHLPKQEKEQFLPIGKARNEGFKSSTKPFVVFLDVDCIAGKYFLANIYRHLQEHPGLIMGTPKYLSRSVTDEFCHTELIKDSIYHPHRPMVADIISNTAYELFWSLCFGIAREDFENIGGFDEEYVGYGAEDTDFAFQAKAANVPFYLSAAVVYHQPHPIHSPPFNHFEEIVSNANAFYRKWQCWPMDGWLKDFLMEDLIVWRPNQSEPIKIKKLPSTELMEASYQPDAPFV